jgi:uncharacterized membrane protein YozB (DUF420 family)
MVAFLSGSGFLGTKAQLGADLSLVLMAVTVALLTVGVVLIKRGHEQAHRWVQTAAVCLSTLVAAVWMVRSFVLYVRPEIPAHLGERVYAADTVHGLVGAVGVLLGVYVVLSANGLLPKALQFRNYKAWMRASYVLYLLGMIGGIAVYVIAYGGK